MHGRGEIIEAYLTYLTTPYQLPTSLFIYFYLAHLALLVCLIYFAYQKVRLAFLIKSTPTINIRSAPQGYVEFSGLAKTLTPIISPLSQTPCVWWSYEIEEYSSVNQRRRTSIIANKQSIDAFILKDKTGECIIHPEGSTVIPHHERTWYGNTPMPTSSTVTSSLFTADKKYRYTESLLLTKLPVYCLGMHHTLHFSPQINEVGDIIREWKRDYKSLLKKYDENADGKICLNEWQAVVSDAEETLHQQQNLAPETDETLLTIVSLEGLPNHYQFVLSGKSEKQLLKDTLHKKVILVSVTILLSAQMIYALLTKLVL